MGAESEFISILAHFAVLATPVGVGTSRRVGFNILLDKSLFSGHDHRLEAGRLPTWISIKTGASLSGLITSRIERFVGGSQEPEDNHRDKQHSSEEEELNGLRWN